MGLGRLENVPTKFFTPRLVIEKCLSHQKPLFLSFIDYEPVLDLAGRRALAKAFSLYGIPDKYITVIGAM